MTGIQFVTDEKGQRIAVQIDLRKYAALWEEMEDILIAESRRSEKSIPFGSYIAKRRTRAKPKN
jgi:hypothetical protein